MQQPWSARSLARPSDIVACRRMLRGGSRTFYAASFLLPRPVREPASALYAFCRLADDAVDLGAGGTEALRRLNVRLDRAYAGRPLPHPADRAFADVVVRFAIPRALPEALLEGLAWDAANRRYETAGDLHAYAARVAGTVGAMMAMVMGVRAPETIARACDLGVAMQLTNIARDVGEDARAGRLYLPAEWLRESGIDPVAWLARPVFSDALGAVVQRLLQAADVLYDRADAGIAALPASCRPGVRAARRLYAEIGREVERQGCDSVTSRSIVCATRKAGRLAHALMASSPGGPALKPCLDEARFLVEAVAAAPPPLIPRPAIPWWNLHGQIVMVIDLFERLERRDRLDHLGRTAIRMEGVQ